MASVRQAVIYSSASKYSMRLLGLVWTMIVARLLTPGEIGTFAIASAIVMVMTEFRLLGAGAYLVREKEIPGSKIRSALGLTVIISWGLGLLIFISAPYVADFYQQESLVTIFRVLALSFLAAPYISIPTAILQRSFQFKTLFFIKIVAKVVGLSSTIAFILMGFSYYSLAFGQIIIVVVEFITLTLMWPKGVPRIPSFKNLKPIFGFGIYSSTANLLKKAMVSTPDMVIGKMGTTTQVGMFSRGLGFIEFVSQSLMMGVNPVALPYLSQTRREGGDVAQAYIKASVLLGGLVWPVLAVASLASLPAIRLFFGDQWDFAAPIASVLAFWAMLRTSHWLSNALLAASGKEKIMVVKEIVVFVPFLMGVIYAFPFGLEYIPWAFVGAGIWDFVVTSIILARFIKLSFLKFIVAWIPNVLVTCVCGAVTYLISQYVDFSGRDYWLPILVIAVILPPVYMASLKAFRHPLFDELMKIIQGVLNKVLKRS